MQQNKVWFAMDLPIEILVYLFKHLPSSDRMAASETCRLWYAAANDTRFLQAKSATFYKAVLDDERHSPLNTFQNACVDYPNFVFQDLELSSKLNIFWENVGENIKSLTIKNCDICEKVFIYILKCCPYLEELKVLCCRELFMSGRLMEGNTEGLYSDSLACLKTLSLAGNRYLSDALFNRFVATAPQLQVLNLSSCAVSFHSGLYKKFYPKGATESGSVTPSESVLTFHFILQFIISRAKLLKRLSFSDTLIDGATLKLLSEIPHLELTALEVHACDQLTNVGILALTAHQTNLQELDIGLCTRVTDLSLVQICDNLHNLQFLNIQRCRAVTDLGICELHKLKKLVSLNISQCEMITSDGFESGVCRETNLILKDLNISSLNLGERSIVLLSERLPNLRYLDVSYCFNAVTDISIQVIFKNQIWLQYLKLSHCDKVSDAGLTGMGKGHQEDSDEEGPIMNTVAEPSYRIHLGSRAEEEIVRDAQRKKDVMKMCENISTDSFSGYSLARLKSLKELNVAGCNRITDVSLIYAFKFKELVTLNLSRCQQITHEGIEYLVKNCPSVEWINLIDCYNLKDEAIAMIVKGLRRLKILELRGCNQLTDKSLESVRSHCERLRQLDVQGCRSMSPELACSLGALPTLHTVLMSKPGPYITDGVKNRQPAPPPPPTTAIMRLLRLH